MIYCIFFLPLENHDVRAGRAMGFVGGSGNIAIATALPSSLFVLYSLSIHTELWVLIV